MDIEIETEKNITLPEKPVAAPPVEIIDKNSIIAATNGASHKVRMIESSEAVSKKIIPPKKVLPIPQPPSGRPDMDSQAKKQSIKLLSFLPKLQLSKPAGINKQTIKDHKPSRPKKVVNKPKSKKSLKTIDPTPEFFKFRKKVQRQAKRYSTLAKVLGAGAIILFLIAYLPSVIYWGEAMVGINTSSKNIGSAFASVNTDKVKNYKPPYQPPYDAALPSVNTLIIPSIGVSTSINEAPDADYEEALKIGVWREPGFGTPTDRSLPIILAAHRFGYLSWSVPYRLKNSFYNLPKLQPGDTVEIIWHQRKYRYLIYGEEIGENTTEMKADLILYTCKDLTSPIRIFKFGRLLEE